MLAPKALKTSTVRREITVTTVHLYIVVAGKGVDVRPFRLKGDLPVILKKFPCAMETVGKGIVML